jgi:hypothetical protein
VRRLVLRAAVEELLHELFRRPSRLPLRRFGGWGFGCRALSGQYLIVKNGMK